MLLLLGQQDSNKIMHGGQYRVVFVLIFVVSVVVVIMRNKEKSQNTKTN